MYKNYHLPYEYGWLKYGTGNTGGGGGNARWWLTPLQYYYPLLWWFIAFLVAHITIFSTACH